MDKRLSIHKSDKLQYRSWAKTLKFFFLRTPLEFILYDSVAERTLRFGHFSAVLTETNLREGVWTAIPPITGHPSWRHSSIYDTRKKLAKRNILDRVRLKYGVTDEYLLNVPGILKLAHDLHGSGPFGQKIFDAYVKVQEIFTLYYTFPGDIVLNDPAIFEVERERLANIYAQLDEKQVKKYGRSWKKRMGDDYIDGMSGESDEKRAEHNKKVTSMLKQKEERESKEKAEAKFDRERGQRERLIAYIRKNEPVADYFHEKGYLTSEDPNTLTAHHTVVERCLDHINNLRKSRGLDMCDMLAEVTGADIFSDDLSMDELLG